ncbi:hypothetical protein POTOM_001665 [Populus tomentosa]|uniref:DUF7036 domain-containing protein n=1 Tax=Populus tomentosa TaxID=118781 RepID=A0A8X8IYX7_POPTO|nr:hypothetical protein POTOM_001665 [Populus tomentosa]
MGLSRISFKCVFILMLILCLLVSALFWIFPLHSSLHSVSGFDAKDEVKLSATVQAYFRLLKPVVQLVTHIARLEYDINEEIGIPNAKVAILSMHRLASNWTDVVFGLIPDPVNVPINMVSLSVLRSSLIDLFLEQSNLTVTTLIFGQPSTFEIFRFPGGITIVPMQYASIWQMPQILFNFTLNNSISEVLDNFGDLKDQLEFGLHLRQFENPSKVWKILEVETLHNYKVAMYCWVALISLNVYCTVYVKITNENGSTITPPVTVQVSVMSDLGTLQLQRLKQLAQIITASPVKNLGLNNSVFGKVKSVVLSSYLKDTLHGTPPTPSPAISPSLPPAIAPFARVNSPSPSVIPALPPQPCPQHGSATPPSNSPSGSNQTPRLHPEPPDVSPLPGVYYGSGPGKGPLLSLVPSTLAPTPSFNKQGTADNFDVFIYSCTTLHIILSKVYGFCSSSSRSFLQEDLAIGLLRVKAIKVAGLSSPLLGFVLSQEICEVKAIPKGKDPQTLNNQQRASNIGTGKCNIYTVSFLTS